jgi:uncharacterized repeat protein (TIGR01451 family)
MRGKLLAFVVSLLAVATIGVVQIQTQAAEPGQVGSAPRCTVEAKGARGSAFAVNGNKATVDFTVKGAEGCKVQLSANSFYAPSMDGRPYDQQTLFDRTTKVFGKGSYSMSVNLPTQSTQQKGCFYQVDLTYGTNNITPVLAYGHGKIQGCGEQPPKPKAECMSLTVKEHEIPRTRFLATATAAVSGGAKIKSYSFTVTKGATTVYDNTYPSAATTQSVVYNLNEPGDYKVKAVVNTSEGPKTSADCTATVTVTPPPVQPNPAVDITKHVDTDKKYKRVGVNVEYTYQIVVKNTGNTDLKNVVVTDTPDRGITLISVSPPEGKIENNTWMHTIATLRKSESRTYTLTAKVPVYLAGKLVNTVCVDAPEVPGSPDKCDKAEVDVPPMGKVQVCNPATGEIIEVNEDEASKYVPVGSPECEDTPVENPKADTPEALPETGPAETILSIVGAMSLVGASTYYVASRRNA